MLRTVLRGLPLGVFVPFRRAVSTLPRTSIVRKASVALLQPAMRAHRGKLGRTLTEVRPFDDPTLSFEPTDSMVMDSVYWFGVRGYEGVLSDVWARLCADAASVLEVGGNIGLFTVLGARSALGQYTVVEPLAENVRVIRANLARNGIGRCEVVEAAAIWSTSRAQIEINIPDEGRDAPVGAHLVIGSEVQERSSARVISVPGIPFAELVAGRDLIKIDAEGIEHRLIESVRDAIVERKPTLVVEVLPESHQLAATLADLATAAGYRISVIPAYGAHAITEIAAGAFSAGTPAQFNSKDVVLSLRPVTG